jgi:2-methylcitrate dehydratase PrpD
VDVTRRLARYVVTSRFADIPQAVRREALRSFLNWIGCTVGGCRHETVDRALAALAEFSGPAQASVLGRSERLDILHAALINGISSHVFDFDDTHLKTIIHPSGPVASAILALSERRPVDGKEFLHAFILGVEVECRIGNAVYPAHYDIGWHITGTAGVFGAAAASGKLIGLNEQQMTWALGIAATQAAGLREMFGTMCKPFHPGRAAQNGLTAALLAAKNFTSSERAIEAPRGFAHVLSTARNFAEITERLGETFEISLNTYKPFACGVVIHPIIDGCIQLRNEHNLKPEQIDRVSVTVHPLVLELTGKKTPQAGLEGKFSVYHSAAVAIIHGAASEHEYSDACVRDPKVIALRDSVTATVDNKVREDEAHITITLKGGGKLTKHVEHAIGSVERPMSDAALEAKFRHLADGIMPAPQVDKLIGMCWSLTDLADAGAVARAAVKGAK